jgi:membrane protein
MALHRTLVRAAGFWIEDDASQMGAALAYYTLFSLAPLLIFAIALTGLVYGEGAARERVVQQVEDYLGKDSAQAVGLLIDHARRPAAGIWATSLGLVTLLFGALGVFKQLRSSLVRIWRLPPEHRGFRELLQSHLVAFVMVLIISIFILLLLTAGTVLAYMTDNWGEPIFGGRWFNRTADFLISSCMITLLTAFTFRFMSGGRVPYRFLWSGSIISAVLFSLGKLLIGYYLAYTSLASAYGAAGSVVVFLVWVYYSAQIFFYGAEIIRVKLQP